MSLDELYSQILISKKQKLINDVKTNPTQLNENEIEDIFNQTNFAVYPEINIFSKFSFDW